MWDMAISAWERRNNRRTGRFPGDMVSQFLFESIRRGEEGRQGGFCATLCVIRARARINWGRRISCRISNIMAENRAVWRSAIMGILPIRSPIPSQPPSPRSLGDWRAERIIERGGASEVRFESVGEGRAGYFSIYSKLLSVPGWRASEK